MLDDRVHNTGSVDKPLHATFKVEEKIVYVDFTRSKIGMIWPDHIHQQVVYSCNTGPVWLGSSRPGNLVAFFFRVRESHFLAFWFDVHIAVQLSRRQFS